MDGGSQASMPGSPKKSLSSFTSSYRVNGVYSTEGKMFFLLCAKVSVALFRPLRST